MEEKTSSADTLPHRGSKIFAVRKPSYLPRGIKIRTALLNPNNKFGFGFDSTREGRVKQTTNRTWHDAVPLARVISGTLGAPATA